ncbi:DUF1513 domain-containing protein [Rhodovulum visakhapatnamense]|uniref:DUF1513 domain-containing protein n=1 Tax=Rhodovulum visakhapatnamense TaxID=364297 RepID=A0A4R8FZF9_9RHOB|nr:DUF1513 domain-containing protein [Rhodovulum visakhapatnamense]TDX32547.1 hypothetical protein EV657_103118 [Rhodovulum visakhapatnamense]
MTDRRSFLAGALAASLSPRIGWADAGSPAFLSAAQEKNGNQMLVGLDAQGAERFRLPLPQRGHAAAAHPIRPEATAFARRPGTFALVIDCREGRVTAVLDAPEGRHFYGHGAYSADGRYMYTPENDYDAARGVIGVWDTEAGYLRVGEFDSHGIGPHDIKLMPDGKSFVIANGGIETHPDSGRAKLNIPFMEPNLAYLGAEGTLLETVAPPAEWHMNSIRHLALGPGGTVAFAMQWEGPEAEAPPLLGLHRRGAAPVWLDAPGAEHAAMQGYAGSVAISQDGAEAAISSPRGGRVHVFDIAGARFAGAIEARDVCGLAPAAGGGFVATTGTGDVLGLQGLRPVWTARHGRAFDNHLVTVGAA